jgi:arginyl-tRNA synthetase
MLKTLLANFIATACQEKGYTFPEDIVITEPPAHIPGDYSANVALQLAASTGKAPREIAEELAESLRAHPDVIEVTIAGPGFLNVTFHNRAYAQVLQRIAKLSDIMKAVELPEMEREHINVEYISANPSGPLHIGNARGGPLGEAIARVLQAQGHTVSREFYVNDIGGQANRFAASILHFYAAELGIEKPFPEDGYKGDYVKELAHNLVEEDGKSILELPEAEQVDAIRHVAIARMVENIKHTVAQMGITFDRWFWQGSLHQGGKLHKALYILKTNKAIHEKDGATWLSAGVRDDDRDSVLVKSDGTTTYFFDDIVHYADLLVERKMDRAICLLGADHAGHPPRMRAGIQALGLEADRYQAVMYQYVQLKEAGERVGMAKREGKFVTALQVLEEVPRDVFTFFMVSKSNDTHVDFDMQLAKDTSEKNPVYSIQYAHARITSMLEKARAEGKEAGIAEQVAFAPTEQALIRQLAAFREIISEVGETYRVNLIATYLLELAARYHQFYAAHRVLQAESADLGASRLLLSELTKKTLAAGLQLLNISAPDHLSRD